MPRFALVVSILTQLFPSTDCQQQCSLFGLLGAASGGGFADGDAARARLSSPKSVAPDYNRSVLYVADEFNHRIRVAYPNFTVSTLAGLPAAGFLDGPCGSAQFRNPTGVALDNATGTLYIADFLNHRIRAIDTSFSPSMVRTWAGTGFRDIRSFRGCGSTTDHGVSARSRKAASSRKRPGGVATARPDQR